MEQILGYENEVLIDEKNDVQLSKKSLTDNSIVYNVYITRKGGEKVMGYSPTDLVAAERLFKVLSEEGPGDYVGGD